MKTDEEKYPFLNFKFPEKSASTDTNQENFMLIFGESEIFTLLQMSIYVYFYFAKLLKNTISY